ncbi:MAG: cysteine--tRNA ligase [Candidatus Pacebacteria bacterium]|nr:cysteine--tRNA ligase [Candidatus Paceibacterota bacterium]
MLKLYNTLSRKKEILKPRKNKKINLFVCGPTVYDFSHIGHARTYISFDVIAKYLRESGYDVFYLQNITDIDDKIIERAKKTKTSPKQLAEKFKKEYFKDVKGLRITSVSKYAKATDYIKEILNQVKRLMKKGYAYRLEDGIYYDISKFKNYGKLSKRTITQAEDGVSRIDRAKNKKNKGDFCLWKKSKSGEPKWPSPWFKGRPGWHIEDTAITEKQFGPQYDIHGGAQDLMFPHHEAEIAQMEAISNKHPLVKYWLHTGFLNVEGQKMAKSLGNFITIKDFLKENDSRILRLLIIKSHYRSPLDYNEKLLLQTKRELERIDEFIDKLSRIKTVEANPQQILRGIEKKYKAAMEDDFNTPKAIALLFNLINKGNIQISQNKLTVTDAKEIITFLKKIDKVFNFIFQIKQKKEIPSSIIDLVKLREKQRKKNNWQKADKIRKKIQQLGYWVEDTKDGSKVKKL